jgi:glutathione S-transferase
VCQTRAVPARLVTIPISHFCEKARWALDRAGVDYVEQPHLQLIHIGAAKLAGGGRTVPVLVTSEGQVVPESSEILRWADTQTEPERRLYPEGELGAQAAALEAELDQGFGPDGRLWMYHQTLPVVHDLDRWATVGIPRWERRFFRMGGPTIEMMMRRYLKVDAAASEVALERVDGVFDDIAGRLSDGRRFLLGDRFTAADLTFAALAAPMLLPARYGSPLPPPEAMPAPAAREVRRLRAHPAGEFADRLYAEERVRVAVVPA